MVDSQNFDIAIWSTGKIKKTGSLSIPFTQTAKCSLSVTPKCRRAPGQNRKSVMLPQDQLSIMAPVFTRQILPTRRCIEHQLFKAEKITPQGVLGATPQVRSEFTGELATEPCSVLGSRWEAGVWLGQNPQGSTRNQPGKVEDNAEIPSPWRAWEALKSNANNSGFFGNAKPWEAFQILDQIRNVLVYKSSMARLLWNGSGYQCTGNRHTHTLGQVEVTSSPPSSRTEKTLQNARTLHVTRV